jgi:hypothetical protein
MRDTADFIDATVPATTSRLWCKAAENLREVSQPENLAATKERVAGSNDGCGVMAVE